MSEAQRVTSPAALTVELTISAFTVFITRLPTTDTLAAKNPDAKTPMLSMRMMAEDSEVMLRVEAVSTIDPVIPVQTVFRISFSARAMPAEAAPPDTPKENASTLELSLADRVIEPSASTSDPLRIPALVVFSMILAESEISPAADPTATPPLKPNIVDLFSAESMSDESVSTVEPDISAAAVFRITLAPMMALSARPPDPAKLRPIAVTLDWSIASRSTGPCAVTVEPPRMAASTLLWMTFPVPVALTATPRKMPPAR